MLSQFPRLIQLIGKIPFIQQVVKYDGRILSLDTSPLEVTPSDDRRLIVDAFARYRIADVVRFRQAVGVGGLRVAEDRLADGSFILAFAGDEPVEILLERAGTWLDPEQSPGSAITGPVFPVVG